MLSPQTEIQLIAIVVAVACAIPGVFLILRRMSMMSDAISHTILLGVVLGFFITHDLTSPLLILGAALMGTITVYLVELIYKSKLVSEDASIGLIFPFLFSIGVILISMNAGDVHLDTDAVLLGEIAFAPFNRFIVGGQDIGPKALYVMSSILVLNIIYLTLFYKELKLSTFDEKLALVLGFSPIFIHYSLMTLVSITAVGAFDSVGAVLVVAFMVGPPATAYLLTDDLKKMIFLSIGIGGVSSVLGYWTAAFFDVAIAGSMAVMVGVTFLIVFIVAPNRGLLSIMKIRKKQKSTYATISFLMHIINHENTHIEETESSIYTIKDHLGWDNTFLDDVVNRAKENQYITINEEGIIKPTLSGKEYALFNYYDFVERV
ncbi:metal ABC transporter permease [Anaeromicrobium sediminis]|uniref:Zinc ABC transporter permease n=1 Tax=Anaeromicrobium sediminis TaxID=1478221 RepID=A0A267MC25_9FIRM|nr:metal ABC transporter permease [Anaeromicrobium sediminis]PAB57144.1 zinc ABC transporter permease [Anaeromicrobium sediminis]